jgi:hypothetical protein
MFRKKKKSMHTEIYKPSNMVSNSLTLTTDLLAHTYNRIIQET